MRALHAANVTAAFILILSGHMALAQEAPAPGPSSGDVSLSGISEVRFNPTHGTLFFRVSGAFFPTDPRDVAVIIGERQLPAGNLAVSRRLVSASYVMPPGPNTITLRAWDASGEVLTAERRVWAGDLTLQVEILDVLGNPLESGELTASLAVSPSVRSTVAVHNGGAVIVNLPDEEILLEAETPAGYRGSLRVRAADRRATLLVR